MSLQVLQQEQQGHLAQVVGPLPRPAQLPKSICHRRLQIKCKQVM